MLKLDIINNKIALGGFGDYEPKDLTIEVFNTDYVRISFYGRKIISRKYDLFVSNKDVIAKNTNDVIRFFEDIKKDLININYSNSDQDLTIEKELEFSEASKYPNRRKAGLVFSDIMNARLNILDAPDSVKDIIDTFFAQTQFFLEGGKWKSAQREVSKLQPIPHPQVNGEFIVSPSLIAEIKANIDGYVSNSYK